MAGSRGPRPVPTHLKMLRGNPGCYPLNMDEPQPLLFSSVPEAPAFLSGYAREEWNRVIPELHRMKLVTLVDIPTFAAYCLAYERWRTAEELAKVRGLMVQTRGGPFRVNPLIGLAERAAAQMVRYASEFGLTPASRSRITAGIGEARKPTKFDGLLAS
jgi:P27 family predicted phage terminase small subunit